eukprot:23525-Chlamydomonas_euryale.AAC.12
MPPLHSPAATTYSPPPPPHYPPSLLMPCPPLCPCSGRRAGAGLQPLPLCGPRGGDQQLQQLQRDRRGRLRQGVQGHSA